MSQKQKSAWDRVIEPWWAKITIGFLMVVVAVFQFNRYSRIESGEEKPPTIVSGREELAYDMGGKWLVSGISGIGGLGLLAWGGYQMSRKQRNAAH
jgi:hypothetical protein